MFDIGWGELLIIGIVALIAIGPKELPAALRALGQWMTKIRRMASEFQNQFQEAMREAELSDLKKEVDDMAAQASKMTHFDPLDDVRKEVETAQRDIETSVTSMPTSDEPVESVQPLTMTSTSGGPDTAPASAEPAPPVSAEPPAVSESNTATTEPTATPSAEPTVASADTKAADTKAADAEAGMAKPDAGKPDAGKPDAGKAPA
jgi:sec-independent protein translocase protein TatB